MTRSVFPDPDYDTAFYDGVFAKRIFAWLIDVVIVCTIMVGLGIVTLTLAFFLWVPFYLLVDFLYRWLTINARSATLGMRVMNIELRGPDGNRLSTGLAAAHTGLFMGFSTFAVLQLISLVLMAVDPMNRGLTDRILGTVMLNRSA
ncbi:RDD family protein [Gymnodinialimonas sp. 2305UL16-5]|uniref:RDD family protein n=1 Tax=Gymnodinialimonas mytili TaxID=3126503 RepID=UPI003094B4CE